MKTEDLDRLLRDYPECQILVLKTRRLGITYSLDQILSRFADVFVAKASGGEQLQGRHQDFVGNRIFDYE